MSETDPHLRPMTGKDLQEQFCACRGVESHWEDDAAIDREAWNMLASQFAISVPVDVPEHPEPRPCLFCGKMLESANEDWKYYQPYSGGEVQFIFAFGSTKFDDCCGGAIYRALVCDDCGQKYVPHMDRKEPTI